MTARGLILGLVLVPTAGSAQSITDASRRDSFRIDMPVVSDTGYSKATSPSPGLPIRNERCDPVWDGPLFGILPGVGVGIALSVASSCGDLPEGCDSYLLWGAVGGAAAGLLLDHNSCNRKAKERDVDFMKPIASPDFMDRPPTVSGVSDPPIRTDQGGVTLRNVRSRYFYGTLAYRFTNRSESIVYIPVCQGPHPPFLQKWEAGIWVLAYSLAVPRCLGEPLEIAPGESIARTYEIIHGMPGSNLRTFRVSEVEGVYRMVWNIYGRRDRLGGTSDLLPLELRVSNPFMIVVEPGW